MPKHRNLNSDYLYIRAFARFMNFNQRGWFVTNQIRRARRAKAPEDVIFHSYETGWQRIKSVKDKLDRATILRHVMEQQNRLDILRGKS